MMMPEDFIENIGKIQEQQWEKNDMLKYFETDIGFWERFFEYRKDPKYFLEKLKNYTKEDHELLKNCILGLHKFYPFSKPLLKVIYEDNYIFHEFDDFKKTFIRGDLQPLLYNDFKGIIEKDIKDLEDRIKELDKLEQDENHDKLKKKYEALKKEQTKKENEFYSCQQEKIKLLKEIQELSPQKDKQEKEWEQLKKNILNNLGCEENDKLYQKIEAIFHKK